MAGWSRRRVAHRGGVAGLICAGLWSRHLRARVERGRAARTARVQGAVAKSYCALWTETLRVYLRPVRVKQEQWLVSV